LVVGHRFSGSIHQDPLRFGILVARDQARRYLLIQESKKSCAGLWYFPAGRIEPGESYIDGIQRETFEEAGVSFPLTGVLRVERTKLIDGRRRSRVIFCAEVVDSGNLVVKAHADTESLGAAWFTLQEIERLPLRGVDVLYYIRAMDMGCDIFPLRALTAL
jgi:phosphatase NudJ